MEKEKAIRSFARFQALLNRDPAPLLDCPVLMLPGNMLRFGVFPGCWGGAVFGAVSRGFPAMRWRLRLAGGG